MFVRLWSRLWFGKSAASGKRLQLFWVTPLGLSDSVTRHDPTFGVHEPIDNQKANGCVRIMDGGSPRIGTLLERSVAPRKRGEGRLNIFRSRNENLL